MPKLKLESQYATYEKLVAAILDLPTPQCLRYFFCHTAMSGIPENPMVDTKIMNLLQLSLRKKMALV